MISSAATITIPDEEGSSYTVPAISGADGIVIAALGDSITEGYHGRGFLLDHTDLRQEDFPPDVVSRNGFNFPQFASTARIHNPAVNCFAGFLLELNDLLNFPRLLIANEGIGGITSGGYLDKVRHDTGWQRRMDLLRPGWWLVHLGVNDGRAAVTPERFAGNMRALLELLVTRWGARPERIFVAKPCYDYEAGYAALLERYCDEVDAMVNDRLGLAGPDFFAAYRTGKARYYGDDPVHPNAAGMTRMAHLWHQILRSHIR